MEPSARSSGAAADAAASGDLIPGLPNEVAELCLLRLPFPLTSVARSVSSTWNQTLTSPSFLRSKSSLSLSLPHLFVLAFDPLAHRLQWQALDPQCRRWFVLPPMPTGGARICGASLACAADGRLGEIYVVGGMEEDGEVSDEVLVYNSANNSWRRGKGRMRSGRAFFAAAAIGGKVIVAGGGDGGIAEVERYDPARDLWVDVAPLRGGMARYDAAVVGNRMLLTEGWTWPFTYSPRGCVYDADRDTWEEMSAGLREGWTGAGVVVGGNLFVVSEYGEGRVKAYDPATDGWTKVAGGGVPGELRRPFAAVGSGGVVGEEGRIYVVGRGMDVGVGRVVAVEEEEEEGGWRVEWEVVKGPKAFGDFAPCASQVLHV